MEGGGDSTVPKPNFRKNSAAKVETGGPPDKPLPCPPDHDAKGDPEDQKRERRDSGVMEMVKQLERRASAEQEGGLVGGFPLTSSTSAPIPPATQRKASRSHSLNASVSFLSPEALKDPPRRRSKRSGTLKSLHETDLLDDVAEDDLSDDSESEDTRTRSRSFEPHIVKRLTQQFETLTNVRISQEVQGEEDSQQIRPRKESIEEDGSQKIVSLPPPPRQSVDRRSGLSAKWTPTPPSNRFSICSETDLGEEEEEAPHDARVALGDDGDVKAGTPEGLVQWFVNSSAIDTNYTETLLVTYRCFISSGELMSFLLHLYWNPIREKPEKESQLRIYIVIKEWVKSHPQDFGRDNSLTDAVDKFIDDLNEKGMSNLSRELDSVLHPKKNSTVPVEVEVGSPSVRKKSSLLSNFGHDLFISASKLFGKGSGEGAGIFDLSASDIAKQLTILDQRYFQTIQFNELLQQSWAKRPEEAPNVLENIEWFNRVAMWIATQIVEPENVKTRAERLSLFMATTKTLMKYNNFNMLMAVVAGVNSAAVYRLKQTHAEVPKKVKEVFAAGTELMSSLGSFRNYREALAAAKPPAVPYLGTYLSDLTFIEDGNPTYIDGLVNFSKFRKVHNVIWSVKQYQGFLFPFEPNETVLDMLEQVSGLADQDLYELSLVREPKQVATSGG